MKTLFFKRAYDKLDEITFENRNKYYGAYALRKAESHVLQKATLLGIATFIGIAAVPFIWNTISTETSARPPLVVEHNLVPVEQKDILPPPSEKKQIEKQETSAQPNVKTFDATLPTPTRNATQQKPAASVEEYQKGTPGVRERDGNTQTSYTPLPPSIDVPKLPTKTQPAIDPNTIAETVDQEAIFPGGINKFREGIINNLDTSALEGNDEKYTTSITFVVEKNGSISNIKADGKNKDFNKLAIDAIKMIKQNWKPATYQGQTVRSYYKVPISFVLE